jgi:hypothetical protein
MLLVLSMHGEDFDQIRTCSEKPGDSGPSPTFVPKVSETFVLVLLHDSKSLIGCV